MEVEDEITPMLFIVIIGGGGRSEELKQVVEVDLLPSRPTPRTFLITGRR
jgi:hypothetical protein